MLTVIRRVLFAVDEGFGVEQAAIRTCPYLVDHIGLEINVQRAGHMLP